MEPIDKKNPRRNPREFVDKALARVFNGNAKKGEKLQKTSTRKVAPCLLCPDGVGNPDGGRRISFSSYPSKQKDLLAELIRGRYAGASLETGLHRGCLESLERELQQAQIRRVGDEIFFVDLTLGITPILPTPIRMNADLRFTGRGVTIAFVDSGFYPHIDFMLPSRRIIGMYDAVRGREITGIERLVRVDPRVEAWHGTMAAATAAGSGHLSQGRYRGLASESRLVLVKVMTPKYRIQTPQVVRALEWIKANRKRFDIGVVNLSLGVDEVTDSMDHPVIRLVEELTAMGVVVVAASGNNPMNAIRPPGASPSAITVGGYNDHNSNEWMRRELWHSSYGNTPGGARKPEMLAPAIWVAAPILPRTAVKEEAEALFAMVGVEESRLPGVIRKLARKTMIADTLRDAPSALFARSAILQRIIDEKLITPDYKHVDGTSFAAPIVSSIVAQMLEARPHLLPHQVKEILTSTSVPLANVPIEVQGHGIVHPEAALSMTLTIPGREVARYAE